jgi:hypothetical protein
MVFCAKITTANDARVFLFACRLGLAARFGEYQ